MLDDKKDRKRAAPGRPHDIIGVIKDRFSALPKAEQAVATAILSDLREAVRASNGDIAARAGVSQPTVTRFCRSIGCEGVRDFKLQLAQSLAVGEVFLTDSAPAARGDRVPPFWDSVLGEAGKALEEVERQVAPGDILAAARVLAAARRIVTVGVGGSSASLAIEAQVRLFRYGLTVEACRDPYMVRMTAATLHEGDVLLALSATGRTPDIVDVADVAARYGARVIAITRPDTPLAQAAAIALTVRINEYPDALTPTASRFGFLAILDLLAAATGYEIGPPARESLRRIKFNLNNIRPGDGLEPLGD